jgi:hypothetical protein
MCLGHRVQMSDHSGATSTGNSRRATKRIVAIVASTHAVTALVVTAAVSGADRNRRAAGKAAVGVTDEVTPVSRAT